MNTGQGLGERATFLRLGHRGGGERRAVRPNGRRACDSRFLALGFVFLTPNDLLCRLCLNCRTAVGTLDARPRDLSTNKNPLRGLTAVLDDFVTTTPR